jgi:DNA-binding transcriptional LysR family regulator
LKDPRVAGSAQLHSSRAFITLGDLWPGLDLRHLLAFAAVAESRSFARAADSLGYTQPAVSQQVAQLERIVGQRLFERSSGRPEATLTNAGGLLLEHVDVLVARLTAARQDLLDFSRGEAGTVRIGAFQSALARVLPRILSRYGELWPAIHIESLESSNDESLLALVRAGELDFAFALLPVDEEVFEYRVLVHDRFVLISKRASRVRPLSSLEELSSEPLILYRTCRSATALVAHLELHASELNIVFRSDDNTAIKEMARAGLGAAILPELWIQLGDNEGLDITPLNDLIPPRVVVLAWRKGRSLTPAQETFVEVATQIHSRRRFERVPGSAQ